MLSSRSIVRAVRVAGVRHNASAPIVSTLQGKIEALAKKKAPQLAALRKEHANTPIGEVRELPCQGL
jgi:hypothetical protein